MDEINEYNLYSEIMDSSSDDIKKTRLSELETEKYKCRVICSLTEDKDKIEVLKEIKSESLRGDIISSLKNDELKLEFLNDIYDTLEKEQGNYFNDEECSKFLVPKHNEFKIVCSIKNAKLKLKLFRKYLETDFESVGMNSLSKDAIEIIEGIDSDEIKLKLINEMTNKETIARIVASLDSKKLQEKFAKENPWYIKLREKLESLGTSPLFIDDELKDLLKEEDVDEVAKIFYEEDEKDLDSLSIEELSEMDIDLDKQIEENEKAIQEQRKVLIDRVKGKRAKIAEQQVELRALQQEKSTQPSRASQQH